MTLGPQLRKCNPHQLDVTMSTGGDDLGCKVAVISAVVQLYLFLDARVPHLVLREHRLHASIDSHRVVSLHLYCPLPDLLRGGLAGCYAVEEG